jgi:hypothetical protein
MGNIGMRSRDSFRERWEVPTFRVPDSRRSLGSAWGPIAEVDRIGRQAAKCGRRATAAFGPAASIGPKATLFSLRCGYAERS